MTSSHRSKQISQSQLVTNISKLSRQSLVIYDSNSADVDNLLNNDNILTFVKIILKPLFIYLFLYQLFLEASFLQNPQIESKTTNLICLPSIYFLAVGNTWTCDVVNTTTNDSNRINVINVLFGTTVTLIYHDFFQSL